MEMMLADSLQLFDVDVSYCDPDNPIVRMDKGGFFYCTQGEACAELDGRTYEVRRNDIYVYAPFSVVRILSASDDVRGVIGLAGFDFLAPTAGEVSSLQDRLFIRSHPCISLDERQRQRIEELIGVLRNRWSDPVENEPKDSVAGVIRQHLMMSLARALCYEVMGIYFSNRPSRLTPHDRKDMVFENFLQSLFRNFARERSVAAYASEQCLTPRYFSTIIHQKSGRTASEWITQIVVMEAKRLLSDSELSIKQIADNLGFQSQSFFGRYFSHYVGTSPSEFRSAAQRK